MAHHFLGEAVMRVLSLRHLFLYKVVGCHCLLIFGPPMHQPREYCFMVEIWRRLIMHHLKMANYHSTNSSHVVMVRLVSSPTHELIIRTTSFTL